MSDLEQKQSSWPHQEQSAQLEPEDILSGNPCNAGNTWNI